MTKTMANLPNINKFLEKIESLKKEHQLDLSSDEDLSIAIMNLVSLEEHFFFTGAKTGQTKYYDLLGKIREIRKELLKRLVKEAKGEVWCISKHLLAASMRLIEVGTKYHSQGKAKAAQDLFAKAYDLYSLFWGINLKVIDIGEVKKLDQDEDRLTKRLNQLVKNLIDCCEE